MHAHTVALAMACAIQLLVVAFAVLYPLEVRRLHCSPQGPYDKPIPEGTVRCYGQWILYGLGVGAQIPVVLSWCVPCCLHDMRGGDGDPFNIFSGFTMVWALGFGLQLTYISWGSYFARPTLLMMCWALLVGVLGMLLVYLWALFEASQAPKRVPLADV